MADAALAQKQCKTCSIWFQPDVRQQQYCTTCRDAKPTNRRTQANQQIAQLFAKGTFFGIFADIDGFNEETARRKGVRFMEWLLEEPGVPAIIRLDAAKTLAKLPRAQQVDDEGMRLLREQVAAMFAEETVEAGVARGALTGTDDHRQAVEDGPPGTELGSEADR